MWYISHRRADEYVIHQKISDLQIELTICRLPSNDLWRHEINGHLYKDSYGWQEPILGDRLYRSRGDLHRPRSALHGGAPDQAKVRLPAARA